jgi:hypothetical protein
MDCASTVCDAVLACLDEPVAALPADGITSAFVFVVGGDVADRFRQNASGMRHLRAVFASTFMAGGDRYGHAHGGGV